MIKNLRVCDSENQLAAEPPYRFTFEYEDFSPQKIAAEIRNENGDVIWQNEEDYKIPIVLAKVELERLTNYNFKVTLTSENGEKCSAFAYFKVGLLGDFGEAEYIGSAFSDTAPVLHKAFHITSAEKAVLYLLTLGFSRCYINGVLASEDYFAVNSDYHKRHIQHMKLAYPLNDDFSYSQYYRAYDVSDLLRVGENHIAVVLGNGWYNQCARIAEGHMEYGEPRMKLMLKTRADILFSDQEFDAVKSNIIYNQLFVGETHSPETDIADALFGGGEKTQVTVYPAENAIIRAAHFPADRVVNTIRPSVVYRNEDYTIYDAGRNLTGVVEVTASAEYGKKITLTFAERLNAENKCELDTGSAGTDVQTDVFISSGKEDEKYSPVFVWHGFRYFKAEGCVSDATVLEIQADLKPEGRFTSENEMLNKTVEIYQNSQWSNIHCGVPSDCPHRERLGYTGDGQLTAGSAMYLADCRAFYRKWLRDIADGQCKKSGHIQHTAPFGGGGGGPAGWGGAIIVVPWKYYLHYGEADILEEYYENMLAFVRYMESRSDNDIVVREEEGGWCLGEWGTLKQVELTEGFVNTCLYVEQLGLLKQIAGILGDRASAKDIEEKMAHKRIAIKNTFLKNGVWDCGKQGAPLFPYAAGVISLEELMPCLEDYSCGSLDTGIFATPILIKALFEANMGDAAIDLLTKNDGCSFGSWIINRDITTLPEYLHGGGSMNHPMFGSYTEIFIENMLGIKLNAETAGFTGAWRGTPQSGCCGRIFTPNGYTDI